MRLKKKKKRQVDEDISSKGTGFVRQTPAAPAEQPVGRVAQGEGSTAYIDPNNRITARKTVGELNTALVGQPPTRMDIGQSVFKQTGENAWEGQGGFQGKVSPVATANPAAAVFQDVEDATREAAKKTPAAQMNQVNQAAQGIKGTVGGIKAGGTSGKWFQKMGKAGKQQPLAPGVVKYGHGVSGQTTLMQKRDSFNRTPFAGNKNVQAVQEEMAGGVRGLTNEEKRAGVQGPVKTRYGNAIYGPEQQKAIETAGRGGKPEEYTPYDLSPEQKYHVDRMSSRIEEAAKTRAIGTVTRLLKQARESGMPFGAMSPTVERLAEDLADDGVINESTTASVGAGQETQDRQRRATQYDQSQIDRSTRITENNAQAALKAGDTDELERMEQEFTETFPGTPLPPTLSQWRNTMGQRQQEQQTKQQETAAATAKTALGDFITRGTAAFTSAATPEAKDVLYDEYSKEAREQGINPRELDRIPGFADMRVTREKQLAGIPDKEMSADAQNGYLTTARTLLFGRRGKGAVGKLGEKPGDPSVTTTVEVWQIKPLLEYSNVQEYPNYNILGREHVLNTMFGDREKGLAKGWLQFKGVMVTRENPKTDKAKERVTEDAKRLWLSVLHETSEDVYDAWIKNVPESKWGEFDKAVRKNVDDAESMRKKIEAMRQRHTGTTEGAAQPVSSLDSDIDAVAQEAGAF